MENHGKSVKLSQNHGFSLCQNDVKIMSNGWRDGILIYLDATF